MGNEHPNLSVGGIGYLECCGGRAGLVGSKPPL